MKVVGNIVGNCDNCGSKSDCRVLENGNKLCGDCFVQFNDIMKPFIDSIDKKLDGISSDNQATVIAVSELIRGLLERLIKLEIKVADLEDKP